MELQKGRLSPPQRSPAESLTRTGKGEIPSLVLWTHRPRRPSCPGHFSVHSSRVDIAQDVTASGVKPPVLMTACRWKGYRMPIHYTECQAEGRGAVARYYRSSVVRSQNLVQNHNAPLLGSA